MERNANPISLLAEHENAARDAAICAFAQSLDLADPFVTVFRDAVLPMAISDPTLADNPIIYANDAFEKLTGYAQSEVVGRNCRLLQGPLTDLNDINRLRDAIDSQARIQIDLLNHRKDGTPFWNRLMVTPVFDAANAARYFVASQHDVTLERDHLLLLEAEQRDIRAKNEQTRAELADSAARLDFALRAARLGTWTFEPNSKCLDASDGFKAIFGREPGDSFSYADFCASIHSEDREKVVVMLDALVVDHESLDLDCRFLASTGETRWVAIRGELLIRRDGSPLSISGVSTDITERKRIEEHRALLAGELTHRVKNTLATVSAIVNQTLRDAASVSEARETIGSRIASLAVAHDLLLRDEVDGASITDIVKGVLAPFDDGRGRLFTISGPPISLDPRVTLALSMALHELATNASKYGALSVDDGHVSIEWSISNDADGRRLAFRWQEDGGPPVSVPDHTGFGSRMIQRVLGQHMRGTACVNYRREGLLFTIDGRV